MNPDTFQQLCPQCPVHSGEQYHMKRMYINFEERVEMCQNPKCLYVRLVSGGSGTGSSTDLLGLPAAPGPGGDEFDQFLNSLCEPSVDSGVDADCSDRSVSSWTPSSDGGSLYGELGSSRLPAARSEAGDSVSSGAASVALSWRPASTPAGRPGTGAVPTGTRSEPDTSALRRAARRCRLSDRRPPSGLSLRAFNNSETRPLRPPQNPKEKRPASRGPGSRSRKAARELKLTGKLSKTAAAATKPAGKQVPATCPSPASSSPSPASSSSNLADPSATTSSTVPAATTAPAAPAAASPAAGGPGTRGGVFIPPERQHLHRAASQRQMAAELGRSLAGGGGGGPDRPAGLHELCTVLNTDQVFVRSRQVKRVRDWARKKTVVRR